MVMATRNQVLSLFGATPQQVMARQRQRDARFLGQLRDPYQMAGGAIGVGLGRLFGGKSEELQAAEQMKEAVAGVDPNDPEALRELAKTVSGFAPERALQIAAYAGQLEQTQMGQIVQAPVQVGTKPIYKQELNEAGMATGKYIEVGREPIYKNVPHRRTKDGLVPLLSYDEIVAGNDQTDPPPPTQQVDWVVNQDESFVRQATEADQGNPNVVSSNVSPEAAERIDQQSGESRAEMTQAVPGIAPPPKIKGELEYVDSKELQQNIDALKAQLKKAKTMEAAAPIRKKLRALLKQQRKQAKK